MTYVSKIKKKSWYFFKYQQLVIDDEGLNAYDKAVYGALCKYADSNTGKCYPALKTLAKKSGCSKPRLVKSINQLVEAGYITKSRRINTKTGANQSNNYRVLDLAYINNALEYAEDEEIKEVLQERLKYHPIPSYREVLRIVNQGAQGSNEDSLGRAKDVNNPSKEGLQELEPNNKNYLEQEPVNNLKEEEEGHIRILKTYEKVFSRTITSYQLELVITYLEDGLTEEMISLAIEESGLNNAATFSYLKAVLDDWLAKGLKSKEEAVSYLAHRKAKGEKNKSKRKSNVEQAMELVRECEELEEEENNLWEVIDDDES